MQGNRATRRSGLVEVLYLFYLWGVDGRNGSYLLLQLFLRCLSFLPANLTPSASLPNVPFPHNSVSTIPRNWVPPVSLLICVLSVTL